MRIYAYCCFIDVKRPFRLARRRASDVSARQGPGSPCGRSAESDIFSRSAAHFSKAASAGHSPTSCRSPTPLPTGLHSVWPSEIEINRIWPNSLELGIAVTCGAAPTRYREPSYGVPPRSELNGAISEFLPNLGQERCKFFLDLRRSEPSSYKPTLILIWHHDTYGPSLPSSDFPSRKKSQNNLLPRDLSEPAVTTSPPENNFLACYLRMSVTFSYS